MDFYQPVKIKIKIPGCHRTFFALVSKKLLKSSFVGGGGREICWVRVTLKLFELQGDVLIAKKIKSFKNKI